jgi:hypothetical protein
MVDRFGIAASPSRWRIAGGEQAGWAAAAVTSRDPDEQDELVVALVGLVGLQ